MRFIVFNVLSPVYLSWADLTHGLLSEATVSKLALLAPSKRFGGAETGVGDEGVDGGPGPGVGGAVAVDAVDEVADGGGGGGGDLGSGGVVGGNHTRMTGEGRWCICR